MIKTFLDQQIARWRKPMLYFWYRWIRLRFNGDQEAIEKSMHEIVGIQNDKMWFLVAAAVIASVGLNTNSPAVVIGAMLVSPLMGPIVGAGYGLAIRDRRLVSRAGRHLLISVVISLSVSTLYFMISPLQELTPELLARTRPTLLDLLVAVAAALAGVIALASVSISATLPGVAIATAIMPPLCTVGYGLATMQWRVAGGAFYLFVVNAVAISMCSYFLFRRMKVKELGTDDASRMSRWLIAVIIVVILAPLSYALFQTAQESRRARAVRMLVDDVAKQYPIAHWDFIPGEIPKLSLFLFTSPSTAESQAWEASLIKEIPHATLKVVTSEIAPEFQQTMDELRNSAIDSKTALQKIIGTMERQRLAALKPPVRTGDTPQKLEEEWRLLETRLSSAEYFNPSTSSESWLIRARLQKTLSKRERIAFTKKWQAWLTLRLKQPVELEIVP